MAIKRYKANADNTIVSAYTTNLNKRGTGSNAGQADVVEVFSIYGRYSTGSQELSRILMNFPISDMITDRSSSAIPKSGSVSFYLRLFDAKTSKTVPKDFKLVVLPISRSWQEGDGLDLENYSDLTKNGIGSNWINASSGTTWTTVGGDYLSGSSYPSFSQSFTTGLEDIEINISELVEKWMGGTIDKYGIGIHLSNSYEAYYSSSTGANTGSIIDNTSGAKKSYYTKRFFARGSQYFFKRPVIEARWDSSKRDDRGDFYYSSSLASAANNLNTIYLYNYVRGKLQNIPSIGTGSIFVSIYSGSKDNSSPSGSKLQLYDGEHHLTGGYYSTGIYTCSVALTAATTPYKTLYDVWHKDGTEYFTGSILPKTLTGQSHAREPVYYLNITNLKDKYRSNEKARFNLYVREKYWSPNIYTKATNTPTNLSIVSSSYRIYRLLDAYEAIPYGTGSDFQTGLSYDVSGNYVDVDMNLLESGYAYGMKFSFYDAELLTWTEQEETFKFRVESYEY
jgi:hypothetical protein